MALPGRPTFKVLLVGDGGVGKTAFVKRRSTGEFKKHEPTIGVEIRPLDFDTNHGTIRFICFERRPSPWIVADLRADGAIIMMDVTSRHTYKNFPTWLRDLRRVRGEIPIVLCGNKVDARRGTARPPLTFAKKKKLMYFETSAKFNYNIAKPFLYLARKLTGDPNLQFVEEVVLPPPEARINLAQQQLNEHMLEDAINAPADSSDDDEEMLD